MPQTLIARVRGILSSKTDNYFHPDDLLDYVNEAYKSVVSSAVRLELDQPEIGGRSIRALDQLRITQDITSITLSKFRSYYTGLIDLTTLGDGVFFEKELYVGATLGDCALPLSEVVGARKHKLDFGHLSPTEQRGYYEFVFDTAKKKMKLYLCGSSSPTVHLTFIKTPSPILVATETLPDLPSRLMNAVILKAASLGGTQEIRSNREDFLTLADKQLAEHLW